MARYTSDEYRNQNTAAGAGAVAGVATGTVGGYKAVKAGHRLAKVPEHAKTSYHLSRNLGGGRAKAVGTAARTAASAAVKAPKKGPTLGALGAGYAGWIGGAIAGDRTGRKLARHHQDKKKELVKSNTVSAFGVEHGEFSKAAAIDPNTNKKPSFGRYAAAGFPTTSGFHGAVAGKPGKKLRAFGNEVGGGTLGAVGGSLAGSVLTGGKPAGGAVGTLAGMAGGGVMGARRNQRKGYYKPQ